MIDLNPIRARLAHIDLDFWWDACAPDENDAIPSDREFVRHAPQDIAALVAEIEFLRSETARLLNDLEDAKMGYCPMCDVVGGCIHDTEGEE